MYRNTIKNINRIAVFKNIQHRICRTVAAGTPADNSHIGIDTANGFDGYLKSVRIAMKPNRILAFLGIPATAEGLSKTKITRLVPYLPGFYFSFKFLGHEGTVPCVAFFEFLEVFLHRVELVGIPDNHYNIESSCHGFIDAVLHIRRDFEYALFSFDNTPVSEIPYPFQTGLFDQRHNLFVVGSFSALGLRAENRSADLFRCFQFNCVFRLPATLRSCGLGRRS